MGRVLVRKAEAVQAGNSGLQPQLMLGGQGGSGMFLTPEKPISPHEAGMQAAMDSMAGRPYSSQQQQQIGQTASRAAQMAGKYGGIAAMLGSGLKNIYDASIQGQAPSLTNMATSAYGAQQFVKPLATRAGAHMGARVGVRGLGPFFRGAGTPQGEMADYTQGAMPQGQQAFRMRDSFDPTQFDMAPPTPSPTPPTLTPENSRQAGLGEFSPGMSGSLQSSSAFNDATEQMKEQQKEAKEEKKEMDKEQREKLAEDMKEQRDEQSMGA